MTTPHPTNPVPTPHHLHNPQNSNSSSTSTTVTQQQSDPLPGWAQKIKSPFPDGLKIDSAVIRSQQSQSQSQPQQPASTARNFLKPADPSKPFLPGQPRIRIKDDQTHIDNLCSYLERAHLTREIDRLLPAMRYIFVQTPSYRHIAPLHHQKSREREIIVDEHPGLHLVWYYQTIFVKPIPAYLFSRSFWAYIEQAQPKVFQAALGFMRSYTFLIQYETDYLVACEKRLIPKLPIPPKPDGTPSSPSDGGAGGGSSSKCTCCQRNRDSDPDDGKRHPTYEEFCAFLEPFEQVLDKDLQEAERFHYGELRLTRINRTAFFLRFKLAYFHIYPQWGSFLQHVLAPVITVFAVSTVVLNSMQVSLAAIDMLPNPEENGWPRFVSVSKWFPIAVIILIAGVVGAGLIAILVMAFKDWAWVNKTNRKKRNNEPHFGEKSHGMIW